jgi:hypothetical protein
MSSGPIERWRRRDQAAPLRPLVLAAALAVLGAGVVAAQEATGSSFVAFLAALSLLAGVALLRANPAAWTPGAAPLLPSDWLDAVRRAACFGVALLAAAVGVGLGLEALGADPGAAPVLAVAAGIVLGLEAETRLAAAARRRAASADAGTGGQGEPRTGSDPSARTASDPHG